MWPWLGEECGDGGGFQFVCKPSLVFGLMNQERECHSHTAQHSTAELALLTAEGE
ncbi:hypothetical protein T10_12533 [Trichinella papuae]|uniref:Uncharacterized protein n=1 Tax=Trichinella papuae TaxID=268474 RepID=A0A0V1N4Y5_9BILA|nr:hypothetical protein T10_12533 [Trichinella papuae]